MKKWIFSFFFLSCSVFAETHLEQIETRIHSAQNSLTEDQQKVLSLFGAQNAEQNRCSSLLSRVANRYLKMPLIEVLKTNPSWLNIALNASFSAARTPLTLNDKSILSKSRVSPEFKIEIEENKEFTEKSILEKSIRRAFRNLNPLDTQSDFIPQHIVLTDLSLSTWEDGVHFNLKLLFKDRELNLKFQKLNADPSKPLFDDVADFILEIIGHRDLFLAGEDGFFSEMSQLRDHLLLSPDVFTSFGQRIEAALHKNLSHEALFMSYLRIKKDFLKLAWELELKKGRVHAPFKSLGISFPVAPQFSSLQQRMEQDPVYLTNHPLFFNSSHLGQTFFDNI